MINLKPNNLSLITKCSRNQYANVNTPKSVIETLRYIPDGFIQRDNLGSYDDFIQKFKQNYPHTSFKKLILKSKWFEKPIGEGIESKVYAIPNVDDYCIKINKIKSNINIFSKIKIPKPAKAEMYGFNFGQPITETENGISILMKCTGESYGIKDWSKYHYTKEKVSVEAFENFINNDMSRLSEFPQKSFDDFIKKMSFIKNQTRYVPDFYNPNNYMIDYKNKKINIVDISKNNAPVFGEYFRIGQALSDNTHVGKVSTKTYENFIKYEEIIREKCRLAAEKFANSFKKIQT